MFDAYICAVGHSYKGQENLEINFSSLQAYLFIYFLEFIIILTFLNIYITLMQSQ